MRPKMTELLAGVLQSEPDFNEFDLVRADRLETLDDGWAELWKRSQTAYLMQTLEWTRITLENPPDNRRREVYCIVGNQDGQVDVIWPFTVYRNNQWRMATPIAADWGDYTSVLVEDGPETAMRTQAAWQAARRLIPCDLFDLRFVRESDPLHSIIEHDSTPKQTLYQLEAPWIALKGFQKWDDYWQTINANHRRDLGRKRRRLAEQGEIRVHEVTDPARGRELIDWMIDHKRIWLDHAEREDKIRLRTDEYPRFLKAQVDALFPTGRCMIFALTLGDRVLAMDLASIDKTRFECNVGTFDYEFRKWSPGHILKEYHIKWALDRGLDYDMRLGDGEHKRFWGNRIEQTTTWRVANSAWGHAYVLLKQGIARLRP